MLLYTLTQRTPLYWPYMFHFTTAVRGLPPSDFGVLKSIYYFAVMAIDVPFGVVADRLGRRVTLALGALGYSASCALYAGGRSFAAYAVAELCAACGTALQSGADSALLYDVFAADDRPHEFVRAKGVLESAGLAGATVAFPFAGLLVSRAGDPTATYVATALIALVGVAVALLLSEPPRRAELRLRAHVGAAIADLWRTQGLGATLAFSALVFLGLRAANALVWNPVLAAAGIPLGSYGALTAAFTLVGAYAARRAAAWQQRLGARPLTLLAAGSVSAMYLLLPLASGPASAALLMSHGLALGVLPVVVVDLLNKRIDSSERRATLLSFESFVQRGVYGAVVIAATAALERRSLSTVLLGFAATSAAAVALVPRITRGLPR
ncbi:MAG TPA: MFS transporter [Myxococcota bacterium]|nr:MFS transporter [Myxococcota bacterium]